MRNTVQRKLAMYKTVQSIVSANAPEWEGIPRFVSLYAEFNAKVEDLENKGAQQMNSITGVSDSISQLRITTAEKTAIIAGALLILARETNNPILRVKSRVRMSDLKNGNRFSCMIVINTILDLADENAIALVDYGVDSAMIQELHELRDQLFNGFSLPRLAIVERKSHTNALNTIAKEIDLLLKEGLDAFMRQFKKSNPHFFNSYFSARLVIIYGTRHDASPSDPASNENE